MVLICMIHRSTRRIPTHLHPSMHVSHRCYRSMADRASCWCSYHIQLRTATIALLLCCQQAGSHNTCCLASIDEHSCSLHVHGADRCVGSTCVNVRVALLCS